jgi:hypothetical protein
LKLCGTPYKNGELCKNPIAGKGEYCSVTCRNRAHDQRRVVRASELGEENFLWSQIETTLLALGGTRVVRAPLELAELRRIISDGKSFPIERVGRLRGAPNDCHSNSFAYCLTHHACRFCTGFALSPDSLWRAHSFIWNTRKQRILETTCDRIAYYGFERSVEDVKILCREMLAKHGLAVPE